MLCAGTAVPRLPADEFRRAPRRTRPVPRRSLQVQNALLSAIFLVQGASSAAGKAGSSTW